MTDSRIQLLLPSRKHGFTVKYDPSGSGNRCFYRCLGMLLKLREDEVIGMIESYMFEHQIVPIRNKVRIENVKGKDQDSTKA